MARVTHLPELSALSEMNPFHDMESDKDTNCIFLQPFIFNTRVTGILSPVMEANAAREESFLGIGAFYGTAL